MINPQSHDSVDLRKDRSNPRKSLGEFFEHTDCGLRDFAKEAVQKMKEEDEAERRRWAGEPSGREQQFE